MTMDSTGPVPASDIMASWPEAAREAATIVVDTYGEPHESSPSALTWYDVGGWKRIVATKAYWAHTFPAPHTDSVETFIDYRVPADRYSDIVAFDGSVMIERTTGEISARCHDEQANTLALNLTHDLVTGAKDVQGARDYYAKEFLDARRKQPTPYMERLRVGSTSSDVAADPDQRVLSDDQLAAAEAEGKGRAAS